MIGLKRIIKAGLLNFRRNSLPTFASILVSTITLSVITILLFLNAILNYNLETVKDKVDITIYFTVGAPEEKILSFQKSISNLPEVKETKYTSASEALAIFRERHKDNYPTIQALDEISINPLGGYLNIKAKDIGQYESIADFLKSDNALIKGSQSIIDKVNYYQNKIVIERLNKIIKGAEKFGLILALIFVALSIAITLNTIRLTIFISKEEIGIMRLVGASKTRVRGPFLFEGFLYGAVSSLITIIIFWPASYWLGKNMTDFLGLNLYKYFTGNFLQIFGIILLVGVALGMLSSLVAIRRYLKK